MSLLKTAILVFPTALFLAGCDNENLNTQLSHATSEADKHTGIIIYGGYSFQLVKVNIDGVDYIANSKGGLVRAGKSE